MKNALSSLEAEKGRLEKQKDDLEAGQDRLRKDLDAVGKDSELGKRYIEKLTDEENEIDRLDGQIAGLRSKVDDQRKKLGDYLGSLDVE